MNRLAIIDKLFEIDAIRFGSFKLKSGIQSPFYLDLRLIISYPKLVHQIGKVLWENVQNLSYDLICGVPYTALPLATYLSLTHNIPMIFKRKEAKSYGTKRIIEGMYEVGQKSLIVEDVITSGSSVLETVTALKEAGITTTDVIVIVDREQGGKQILQDAGLTVHSLFTISEILSHLQNEGKIETEIASSVKAFLEENQCLQA